MHKRVPREVCEGTSQCRIFAGELTIKMEETVINVVVEAVAVQVNDSAMNDFTAQV